MINFQGRGAIVTGAGRGIGAAIARTFATLGAAVAIIDVDEAAVSAAVSKIREEGGEAHGFTGGVQDGGFVRAAVAEARSKMGSVDILVNNAGIIRDNLLEKMTEDDWNAVLDVNLTGAFLCSQAVVPAMKERGYGRIVNIVSRAWLGSAGQSNYSASKGGLVSLTRALALELATSRVTVNGVAPGVIDTPMTRKLPEKVRERLIRMQPTGAMGTVDDVAAAVAFLASDTAGFITGEILHVDGGKSCGLLSL
jgi:NAD(P)-dependent dehydrogenase (short-subunit alcohol dehydrogenase family)